MTRYRKILWWFALTVVVLGLASVGWSVHFAWEFTKATHRPVGAAPKDFPFPVESVRFKAEDGLPIAGWFVPCPGATRVAVLLHGAKRNRLENVARARLMREHGYAVLLYDARGCGESGGDMLTFGFQEPKDLLGALDYLRGRGFHQFGLIGFSQGGVTILNAAGALRELCWVVLECTPSDLRLTFGFCSRLVEPLLEWQLGVSPKDYTPPVDHVTQLHCPLYVIAGGADVRSTPEEVRSIFDRANEPKWFWLIPGIPHINYYPKLGAVYERHVLFF
jgi:dipeptidyl aminopeptidase/acylaminoacyl peptidase